MSSSPILRAGLGWEEGVSLLGGEAVTGLQQTLGLAAQPPHHGARPGLLPRQARRGRDRLGRGWRGCLRGVRGGVRGAGEGEELGAGLRAEAGHQDPLPGLRGCVVEI